MNKKLVTRQFRKIIPIIMCICMVINIFNNIERNVIADDGIVKDNNCNVQISRLRVAGLDEAYGVQLDKCNFSWILTSDEHDVLQESYNINIYSDVNGTNNIYSTGWINSDESNFVTVQYKFLENTLYYWNVEVNTTVGYTSSAISPFTTEAGNSIKNSKGIWLDNKDFVLFRCEEKINKNNIAKAVYSVSGISSKKSKQYIYTLYLNGKNIGVGPAVNDGEKVYYNSYDVTDNLINGNNVFTAICYATENRSFISVLTVFYKDGSKATFFDTKGGKWQALSGDDIYGNDHTTSVGTVHYYYQAQENINANIYPFGWQNAGYKGKFVNVQMNNLFGQYKLTSYPSKNMKQEYIGAKKGQGFSRR